MNALYKHSSSIIKLLIGILLICCVYFRIEWFVALGKPLMYFYHVFIVAGSLLITYSGAKLIGLKGWHGIGILVVTEIILLVLVQINVKRQTYYAEPITKRIIRDINQVHADIIQYNDSISEYNPLLGYLYKPNSGIVFKNFEFAHRVSTNRIGLRDDDESIQNPEIIALGDSFTTGWGVGQEETYPQQLEHLTHNKVLNAGVSSFGTVRESVLLNQLDKDSCNWVIIQYCMNDFDENKTWADSLLKGGQYQPSFNRASYNDRVLQNTLMRQYSPFSYTALSIKNIGKKLLGKDFSWKDKKSIPKQVKYFLTILQKVRRDYQGNILVISLSNSPHNMDLAFIEEAQRQIRNYKFSNVHLFNVGQNLLPTDNYAIDGHLNPKGAKKVAENIAKFLADYEKSNPSD